jgi:hypothetical protein
LRCLLSSPGSAQAVLAARAQRLAAEGESSEEEKDSAYRPQVTDLLDDEEAGDDMSTAPFEDAEAAWTDPERRRLAGFTRRAQALEGPSADRKLEALARTLGLLLQDGYRPVVFCRFIATADYLAGWLPKLLGRSFDGLEVRAVTGEVGDEERRERIDELVAHEPRVLVATDCLSEGINLQEHFDAVLHYDLPWNPNRLEQREGRVDRFGQPRAQVKAVLLYGTNNEVDQVVLDVLLRKAHAIRTALGVSVPVPEGREALAAAVRADPPVATREAVTSHPLAAWVEGTFGLATDDGRLVRRVPLAFEAGVQRLVEATGLDPKLCRERLRAVLEVGNAAEMPTGEPVFAFRLHQFLASGGSVYATLEPPATRALSTEGRVYAPNNGGDEPKLLYPLATAERGGINAMFKATAWRLLLFGVLFTRADHHRAAAVRLGF